MHYEEFVRRVEAVAAEGLRQSAAERAIAATLMTLGERLTPSDAERLAAQLALPLQGPLMRADVRHAEFGAREFLRRVAARERLTRSEALDHVRAVLHVLEQAISAGERARLRRALSDGCATLLRPPAAAQWPDAHERRL
jgi:uncharacterized protein (DUF2267 family)